MIEAVREAGIEIRLEGHGAAADKPGAVLLLRAEQVLHALLICAVGDRQAGGLQSVQPPPLRWVAIRSCIAF